MTSQPDQHEKRKFPRVSITDGEYGIRFQGKGLEIENARLVNLSAGGCGLEVQMAEAHSLEMGDIMESLYLDHPDLPLVPLSGVIVRMLGKVPGKTSGYILMGIEFMGITPFIQGLIADHVTTQLRRE